MKPTDLFILGKPFSVMYEAAGHADLIADGDECYGRNIHGEQRLVIDKDLPLETEQVTILHEILHSIEHDMGMEFEESEIVRLSVALAMVLRQNPDLLNYLGLISRPGAKSRG